MIITIDGPAGTGKTTIAKKVAECLHFAYFDTGAMYRAVSLIVLKEKIDLSHPRELEKRLQNFSFRIELAGKDKRYFVGEDDITEDIRSQAVTKIVSEVSALAEVRAVLWKIQRDFAALGDAVFEGRDMGSVVFPQAELKIFLTARPEIRAKRRLDEILAKNPKEEIDQKKMLQEIVRRDTFDSNRTLAPLKCPQDAFQIDTSDLSIDEVVEQVLKHKMRKESQT